MWHFWSDFNQSFRNVPSSFIRRFRLYWRIYLRMFLMYLLYLNLFFCVLLPLDFFFFNICIQIDWVINNFRFPKVCCNYAFQTFTQPEIVWLKSAFIGHSSFSSKKVCIIISHSKKKKKKRETKSAYSTCNFVGV